MIKIKKYIPILVFVITLIAIISVYIIFSHTYALNLIEPKNNNTSNVPEQSKIDLLLSSMSTEKKVGQLFICGFRKDISGKNIYSLNNELKNEIEKYNLGGLILFSENMQSVDQLKKLITDLDDTNVDIPMFISVDAEGGLVDRLAKSSITKSLPCISKLGKTNDTNLSYEYSKIIGRQLASLGFNLDFAPVCDLDNSDAIKYRSFGKDPITVGKMVSAYIKGLNEYKIGSTLKHFPGLGSSIGDTHNVVSHSSITLENLEKNDFIPFKYGIDAGSNIVMINHVIYDNLSKQKLPSSLNSDIYSMLRNKLNFNGIIITDGLEMGAITKQNITTTPSYAAFVAGADILLLPENIDKSYNEILNGVNSGKISIERLDSSVKRILEYKYELGMFSKNETNVNLNDINDQKVIDSINNY
jgi:beta-N-acetylhexosaminidase